MATHDKDGRPYAKLSDLKVGDTIEIDDGFSCRKPGLTTVLAEIQDLYFRCKHGKHFLGGQLEDEGHLIGIYHATKSGQS